MMDNYLAQYFNFMLGTPSEKKIYCSEIEQARQIAQTLHTFVVRAMSDSKLFAKLVHNVTHPTMFLLLMLLEQI